SLCLFSFLVFFFFQAEDGIRDLYVTGVQTCALPIFHLCGAEDADRLAVRVLGHQAGGLRPSRPDGLPPALQRGAAHRGVRAPGGCPGPRRGAGPRRLTARPSGKLARAELRPNGVATLYGTPWRGRYLVCWKPEA